MKLFKLSKGGETKWLAGALVIAIVGVVGVRTLTGTHADASNNTMSVGQDGVGGGTITSSPAGIDCGDGNSTCDYAFPIGTSVTLTATPDPGRTFGDWSAYIDGGSNLCPNITDTCVLTAGQYDNDPEVIVDWDWPSYSTQFVFEGTGSGTITSSDGSLRCTSSCTQGTFSDHSTITFTATAAAGSVFDYWDTTGPSNYCAIGGGIGGSPTPNSSPTCIYEAHGDNQLLFTAVPKFDKSASTSTPTTKTTTPTTTTTKTPSSTPSPTSTAKPTPTYSITLPTTTDITLWNGSNFGQSGQTLTPTTSPTTQVGLADKSNDPLAEVTVNLSSAQNWTSSSISTGFSATSYKSYVHGLTSAPGVVGGVFTLFVPYKAIDKYVGICPGASSLTVLSATCSGLYYLTAGQSETNKDNTNIASGDTVTSSIITINNAKYWEVSGLTGTGGFSSATNTVGVAKAKPIVKPKHSSTALYIVLVCVLAAIVAAASTYKVWLPKIKKIKHKLDRSSNNTNIVTPSTNQNQLNNDTHSSDHDNNSRPS